MLKYLNGTCKSDLFLLADNLHVIKWYVDASFDFNPGFKSHNGGVMTLGGGVIQSIYCKQILNHLSRN